MRRFRAVAAVALLAAGCATTDTRVVVREMQDVSATRAGRPVAKVAVVTVESDAAKRKTWDDAFATRFAARGTSATSRDGLPGASQLDGDAVTVDGGPVIEAARRAGADAILFVQPPSDTPPASQGAYRWYGARSDPDPRTDLETAPVSVTEVRLYGLEPGGPRWRAMVVLYYPTRGPADAARVADSVADALAKRGFLGAAAPR